MATTLQVLRTGLDVPLNMAQDWDDEAGEQWETTLTGVLRADTLDETQALGTELLAQAGQMGPIVSTCHPTRNGFYYLNNVRIGASWSDAALQGKGFLRFTLDLTRVGGFSGTALQSLLSLVDAAEDFATTESFSWAPAIGARSVDAGAASPVLITRDGAEGPIQVATDINLDVNPTWSIEPENYYAGAVTVTAGGRVRGGLDMPMDVTDWTLGNSFMEIRASVFQGASDGELQVRFHDGTAWGAWIPFEIRWAGTTALPKFHFVSIIWNTAEAATIRLQRDALEDTVPTTAMHELDLTLRRGGRLVTGVYKFTGAAATHSVAHGTGAAATRPGGTASYVVSDTAVDGDDWVLGSPQAFTYASGEIQINVAAQSMRFWIGGNINEAANGTGNGPADLAEQYVGQVTESVRARRR